MNECPGEGRYQARNGDADAGKEGKHEVDLPVAERSSRSTEGGEAKGWPKMRLRMVSHGLENDPGCISDQFLLAFVIDVSVLLRSTTPAGNPHSPKTSVYKLMVAHKRDGMLTG